MANYGAHVTLCKDHGETSWCFKDYDGTHLDYEECACLRFRPSPNCDLLVHRMQATIHRGHLDGAVGV